MSNNSSEPSGQPADNLTEHAKRYGKSYWVDFYPPEAGKSGLTPIDPPLDLSTLPLNEQEHWDEIERMQRFDMAGFTSWELVDIGCLRTNKYDEPDPDGLAEINIHPFFRRSRWIDSDIPIGEGFEGTFSASNDILWKALLPGLKFATLAFKSSGLLLW